MYASGVDKPITTRRRVHSTDFRMFFFFSYVRDAQIHHYVSELNNLESRKGRKPLDVNNVVYWFKNARAAQKRAEVRGTHSGQ